MRGDTIEALVATCRACHKRAEKKGWGLDGWERLNTVTLYLMAPPARLDFQSAFWSPPLRKKKGWLRERAYALAFDPTPRLVKGTADHG